MRRSLGLTACLLALASHGAASPITPEPLVQADRMTDARALMIRYEEAIRANPDDMEARLRLSESLIMLGDYQRAELMALTVVSNAPSDAASLALSEALFGQGRLAAAETALEDTLSALDNRAFHGIIRAEQALQVGSPDAALTALALPIEHSRFGARARLIAARAQYTRGDLVRASRLVESIIDDGGVSIPTLTLRAQLALKSGDTARARELVDNVMTLAPGNVAAGTIGVEAALRERDLAGANAILAALRPLEPNDPRPAFLTVMVRLAEGRIAEASNTANEIEEWLRLAPGGAILQAQIKIALNRPWQAEQLLSERIGDERDGLAARLLLIDVYDQTDREVFAERELASLIRQYPDNIAVRRKQTDRLLLQGDLGGVNDILSTFGTPQEQSLYGALSEFTTAGGADGSVAGSLVRAATALRGQDIDLALRATAEAVEQSNANPVAVNLRAAAEARAGEVDAARATLDGLIQEHPDFLAAIANRASLDPRPGALLEQLENAIEAGATAPDVMRQLSIERFVAGQTITAIELARSQHHREGSMATTLHFARILIAADARAEAATVLRRGIAEVTDDDVDEVATLLMAANASEAAATLLEQRTMPNNSPEEVIFAADALEASGHLERARTLIRLAFARQSDSLLLAEALLLLAAKTDVAGALSDLETNPRFQYVRGPALRARLLAVGGRDEAAWQTVVDAPASGPLFVVAASMADTSEKRSALLDRLAAWASHRPTDIAAQVLLSAVALDAGEADQAEAALELALAASPEDPQILNNLALARLETNIADAERLASRAYRLSVGAPAMADTYARVLDAAGQTDRATTIRRRSVLFHPNWDSGDNER